VAAAPVQGPEAGVTSHTFLTPLAPAPAPPGMQAIPIAAARPPRPASAGPTIPALRQGLTLVPISTQLELTLPLSAQLKLILSPTQAKLTRRCGPKVLKLSSNVSDVSRRSSS